MNKVYQVVWNKAKRVWQAASELSQQGGKGSGSGSSRSSSRAIAAGTLFLFALPLHAADLPSGGQVVGGQGSISSAGKTLTVNQNSQNLAINWQDFSIAEGHSVNFAQPNAQAAALNRVTGNNVSDIRGAINANGRVFLVNPNGVMFSSTARVDVGALVASTLDISTSDFMAGNFQFEGASANAIINQGNITTAAGGVVAMIAARIINTGNITTPSGSTLMGAGSKVTLDLGGPVKIEVEEALLDTYIEQGGAIKADGGLVYLTAKAAGGLASSIINHTGITEARTLASGADGRIMLMGDMDSGQLQVAGTLDASAPNGGDGGFIETSAAKVQVNDVKVTTRAESGKTGEWLIDPTDIEIVAGTGGDVSGDPLTSTSSSIGADTLIANLANNNITVQTPADGSEEGNITVSADIVWGANTRLTLDAINKIYVNATIENTNTTGGGVYFNATPTYDMFSYTDNVIFANDAKVVIHNVNQLQWISQALAGNYELGSDIDASVTSTWNDGLGFAPIKQIIEDEMEGPGMGGPGMGTTYGFTGRFDGRGHTIDGLTINRPDENQVGLFGQIDWAETRAEIKNIALTNVNITGQNSTGALIGQSSGASITNASVSGSVSGSHYVGGLVGNYMNGVVSESYANVGVIGFRYVGGLVGSTNGTGITNTYATGTVSGSNNIGGLVGSLSWEGITNSYASNSVSTSGTQVGGLVGDKNSQAVITHSYYDIEANTGSMTDSALGKTKAEILNNANNQWNDNIWKVSIVGHEYAGYATDTIDLPVLAALFKPSETLFEDGFGTEQNPFTITDWNQLQNINYSNDVLTSGYYFTLSNNLGSAATGYADHASSSANGGAGWQPIGDGSNAFNGTFDGLGHVINGLFIYRPSTDDVGLFGYTSGASAIRNIGLYGGLVTGEDSVGSLVGTNRGTLEHVYATGDIAGDYDVGALVGYNAGAIDQAYATGKVEGAGNHVGGLVGSNSGGSISQAYATGAVNGNNRVGGLVGLNDRDWNHKGGTIDQTYATGTVSGQGDSVGGLVGSQGADAAVTNSYYATTDAAGNLINQVNYSGAGEGKTSAELKERSTYEGWDDTVWTFGAGQAVEGYGISRAYLTNVTRVEDRPDQSMLFASGWGGLSGAEQAGADGSAYTITTGQQLQNINLVASQEFDFELSSDIDLADVTWTPIGSTSNEFSGTFDGQGHSLSNLTINQPEQDYIGLFGYTSGATIKNVGLVDVNVTGSSIVGALAGYANQSTTISNVYATGTVSGADKWIGGLVGLTANNSSIMQSYATSVVTGSNAVGGLVGLASNSSIEESYASGAVTGNASVGGLVGASSAVPGNSGNTTVTNSFWNTETSGQTTSAGGTGKTTAELQSADTFADWDLSTTGGSGVWRLYEGQASPLLRSFMTVATISGNSDPISQIYDASTKVDNALLGLGWVTADGSHFDSSLLQGNGFSLDSKNVGSRSLTHDFSSGQTGYDIVVDASLSGKQIEVTPFALNLNGLSAADKTYDGSKAATLIGTGSINAFEGDSVTLSGTASGNFADKNADIGKAVTLSGLGLEGADAANYTFTLPTDLTATINQKAITISGISAADKIYDAGTTATVDASNASGWIAGDDVQVSASGTFADKNANADKTVNLTSSYSGDDADNYVITDQDTTTASISQKTITISGISAADKVYDAGTIATVDASNASGWIAGDDVQVDATGQFADKHAETNKTVNLASSYSGDDADNYVITDQGRTTASISQKAITISGINAADKVYDAGTAGTVDASNVSGWIAGDDVQVSASGEFADKHADTGKTVNLTSSYSGADVKNYDITDQATTTASIDRLAITVSGITADGRDYDGTTDATVNTTNANGWLADDDVKITATGAFADKHAGAGKTIDLTSSYSGADVRNYDITDQATTTASIDRLAITVSGITAEDRVYDGTTGANVDASGATGWLSDDDVQVTATGSFADRNAGSDKTVNLDANYSGDDVDNYVITDQANTTAGIDRRSIKVTADNLGKDEGALDPTLTYQTGCGASTADCGLVDGESLFGELNREAGETAGNYAIQQGSVDDESNPNYDIEFEEGALVIAKVDIPDIDDGNTGGGDPDGDNGGDADGDSEESSNSHLSQVAIAVIQQTSGGGGIGQATNGGAQFGLSFLADTNRSESGFGQSGGLELVETDQEGIESNVRRSSSSQHDRLTRVMVVQGGIRLTNSFTNPNQD